MTGLQGIATASKRADEAGLFASVCADAFMHHGAVAWDVELTPAVLCAAAALVDGLSDEEFTVAMSDMPMATRRAASAIITACRSLDADELRSLVLHVETDGKLTGDTEWAADLAPSPALSVAAGIVFDAVRLLEDADYEPASSSVRAMASLFPSYAPEMAPGFTP